MTPTRPAVGSVATRPHRIARRARAAFAGVLVLLGAGCTDEDRDVPDPDWQVVTLPTPPGAPGRLAVRDAVRCGTDWYVVGGVFLDVPTADQDTRPAAWRSRDGLTWTPLPVRATTYWGRRAVLASLACAHGRVTVVGARSGGAHGNPRVTTFFQDGSGLHDVVAAFSQYGGEQATNVGPVSGGDPGWLITGNRTSGPAVWTSGDGVEFTRHEGVPGLADDDRTTAFAQAAAWDGDAWVVVGGGHRPGGLDQQPLAWTSPDGSTWRRERVPGSDGFDDLERALPTRRGLLALGLRDGTFGAWRRTDGRWRATGTFGSLADGASASPFVAALAGTGGALWATTSDGARYALWHSADGRRWDRVATPLRAPSTAGDHLLSVAADGRGVLLLADDGVDGRLWWASAR